MNTTQQLALLCLVMLTTQGPMSVKAQDAEEPKKSASEEGYTFPLRAPLASEPINDSLLTQQKESWYGWKILISGGASLVSVPVAFVVEPGLTVLPVTGYVFSGPIIHLVHGSAWKALGSLGINLLVPTAGGALGLSSIDGALIGVSVGMLIAICVDSFALGYEPITEPEGSSFHIGLSFSLNGLSVVGQF